MDSLRRPARDLIAALTALVRSHNRLARLYPETFDYAAQAARENEERDCRAREAVWRPALDRIYALPLGELPKW